MALTVDSAQAGNTSGTPGFTPSTWTHTCSGPNGVLVVFSTSNQNPIFMATAVTYAGISMTQVPSFGTSGITAWILINPPTGANTVSVTYNNATTRLGECSISFSGADQITGYGAKNSTGTTTANPTTTLTTMRAGSILVNILSIGNETVTAMSGQTPIINIVNGGVVASSYKSAPTAGSNSIGYTALNTSCDFGAIEIMAVLPPPPTNGNFLIFI